MLRSLCAYATIFCFCHLLFTRRFCCSKLVLFCPVACLIYTCLSSIKEGTCSWACLVFFCLFFDFFFLSHQHIFCYCLCLFSSCISWYVCHFLWFGFSFLHAVPTVDTFYCSLFLFIMFFLISFHSYPFIQKDLSFCGPNSVYWIKGYWT